MKLGARKIIASRTAPQAYGAYAQATAVNMPLKGLVFASGQIGVDAATGTMPEDAAGQATQAMKNVMAVLAEGDSGPKKTLAITLYLTDINERDAVTDACRTFFPNGEYPALSVVEVSHLPKDALVEIEAIAHQ